MLILTRHIGEQVKIGDDVTLTVVDLRGKQVRIGIQAPREVEIDREEIRKRKQRASARESVSK
jgi:carbon storage regulator